jgi:hypothetical protein
MIIHLTIVMENPKVRNIRITNNLERNNKRKHSKKRKEKPQFYFHDVDSNQAAISSPSPYKSPNKKDEDIDYFDNYVLGGTTALPKKVHKSEKQKHEQLTVDDPNKLEYN